MSVNILQFETIILEIVAKSAKLNLLPNIILGNQGVTHSVPTAFIIMMNAVGTEWVIMMNAVGTEWVIMMNAVGTEWVTPGLPRMAKYKCLRQMLVLAIMN